MSAVIAAPMASKSLARELWISLASLLRSHVEMRSLAQPAAGLRIISTSDTHVELESRSCKLRLTSPDASGAGTIEFCSLEKSTPFFFTEDGLVHFKKPDAAMEMEAAVEHLLDKVCE